MPKAVGEITTLNYCEKAPGQASSDTSLWVHKFVTDLNESAHLASEVPGELQE